MLIIIRGWGLMIGCTFLYTGKRVHNWELGGAYKGGGGVEGEGAYISGSLP